MPRVFGFLPKAKQEVISEFGLDKAYTNDRTDFIKDLLAFKDQLYSSGVTPEEINGIVIFVRGEVPEPGQVLAIRPQDGPYGKNIGWKIHLRVKPRNYMFVYLWLKFNCPHGWKHLAGGDPLEKDFTIYSGSWDNTSKISRILKEELDDRLEEPTKHMLEWELKLLGKISARFNCQKFSNVFHPDGYGYLGIPILLRRQDELLWNTEFKKDFAKRKKYWIRVFVDESLKALLRVFNDTAKRIFLLGNNDVVLKVIESALKILPD